MSDKKFHILLFVGTSAEVIKTWSVWTELTKRPEFIVTLVSSQQQGADVGPAMSSLGITDKPTCLSSSRTNLQKRSDTFRWAWTCLRTWRRLRRHNSAIRRADLIVVQGDTMTTLLGAVLGWTSGIDVAHVEAGMRSGSWREPFPEELTRRLVSKIAALHFCPGEEQARNLMKYSNVFVTHGNTGLDALHRVLDVTPQVDAQHDLLVSLHRQELIASRERLTECVDGLLLLANAFKLSMIVDSQTAVALRRLDLTDRLLLHPNIALQSKLPYPKLVALLSQSRGVITDSGGLQQECAALGIPCLVHRVRTETQDGFGASAELSHGDVSRFVPFAKGLGPTRTIQTLPSRFRSGTVSHEIARFLHLRN